MRRPETGEASTVSHAGAASETGDPGATESPSGCGPLFSVRDHAAQVRPCRVFTSLDVWSLFAAEPVVDARKTSSSVVGATEASGTVPAGAPVMLAKRS